jgi:predicted nucleotide-binding protein
MMSPLKEHIINYILKFISEREREVRISDLSDFIAQDFANELEEECKEVPLSDMYIDSIIRESHKKYNWTYTDDDEKLIGLTKEGDEAANHPKGILGYLADNENKRKSVMTNRVFIVHGHNDAVKEKVARFVEHLKLTPIILHEQIDRGQTIIEKVESNSNDVNFAIVLLTADDEGKAKTETDYKLRARQNVIFEMGYFFGLLSRSHVFLLLDDDVEKPSDLSGIVYNSLKEDWKTKLFKELQACGYKVDPEDLLI